MQSLNVNQPDLHQELWLQTIRQNNRRTTKTIKSSARNKENAKNWFTNDNKALNGEVLNSNVVQDLVLRMTQDSAKDFLCTAKSSLMSTAGQSRVFHHLLLPVGQMRGKGDHVARSNDTRNSEPSFTGTLPKALTVLAMASRKRRMHLAPCSHICEPTKPRDPISTHSDPSSSRLGGAKLRQTKPLGGDRLAASPDIPFLGWD